MLEITIEENQGRKLLSQYGYITYRQWCLNEIQRLAKAGIYAEVRFKRTEKHGNVCSLWVEVTEELEKAFQENFKYDNPQVWAYKREQLEDAKRP